VYLFTEDEFRESPLYLKIIEPYLPIYLLYLVISKKVYPLQTGLGFKRESKNLIKRGRKKIDKSSENVIRRISCDCYTAHVSWLKVKLIKRMFPKGWNWNIKNHSR